MQTPAQAAKKRGNSGGQKLPQPWTAAEDLKAHFRRGQLAMIVAAPGVGKSIFANAYAVLSGAKTLYLSMDTDAFTMSVRLVAMVAGVPMHEAEAGLARGDDWALAAAADPRLENLSLAFPSNPDATEVAYRLHAYREARGEFPELLFLDNLQNVGVGDDEFSGQLSLLRELQAVAGQTGTAIVVLHHATGEYGDGDGILPQSGIRGKLSQFPAMILTLHRAGAQRLGVSVVKNRFGPADPAGIGTRFHLRSDMEKAQLTDAHDDHLGHMN